jgi:Phosphotransferase enzyme family
MSESTAGSVHELLAGATEVTPIESAGKSGARLDRVLLDGERYVVKYLDADSDWTLRAAGVDGGAVLELWRRGILAGLPGCIDQPIVGVARDGVTVVLMRDVGEWLVPVSDDPVPLDQHLMFIDHMAALHAHFWETDLDIDVVPAATRYLELSPRTAEREAALGSPSLVPRLVGEGWPLFATVAPRAAEVVVPLTLDPTPLVTALDGTPATFVHGNWKLDNIGTTPDGRTILLDWETPGRGAGLSDLAWYLAINCRRLPQSKEAAIDAYRAALERQGIRTEEWWARQLGLCLIGALVQFGWEKAFSGYDDELAWWDQRVLEAAPLLA